MSQKAEYSDLNVKSEIIKMYMQTFSSLAQVKESVQMSKIKFPISIIYLFMGGI